MARISSTTGTVSVAAAASTAISVYNEITNVPQAGSATVMTYTVPLGQVLTLSRVLLSTDSISTLSLQIDGQTNAQLRIYYTQFNATFEYGDLVVASGSVVTITAINNSLQGVASFNATLQGVLA